MNTITSEIIEEIVKLFGRTGGGKLRVRKLHASTLYNKFINREKFLTPAELGKRSDLQYCKRIVNFSDGLIQFSNEEKGEMILTEAFFEHVKSLEKRYEITSELGDDDEELKSRGLTLNKDDSTVSFDKNLTYSRFYKLVSDEAEDLNDPSTWRFNEADFQKYESIDLTDKNSDLFNSRLCLLKFQVLRKIDEVAFVTSRYVICPKCNASYSVSATEVDFLSTFKCKNKPRGAEKPCGATLKKFPVRKFIPTYIYEASVEVRTNNGDRVEYKEFFIESFTQLNTGFNIGLVFGRTETKSNEMYFTCLKAREEKPPFQFEIVSHTRNRDKHQFFNVVDSVMAHLQQVGFVLDEEKARLLFYIETLKRVVQIINPAVNYDHSLYFGAPGIGKTYGLTLLHYAYYANSGIISGPRFTIAGLTGGQREILYQDTSKRKSVPGMFSRQAFVFDEMNNPKFLHDGEAINLFKSAALESSGSAATVGGKEFVRTAVVAGSANYDFDHLKHYENKVRKLFKTLNRPQKQEEMVSIYEQKFEDFPEDFDFFKDISEYGVEVSREQIKTLLKIRTGETNFLTNFPKPLMERFYWTVLVHPKYDRLYMDQKRINVLSHLSSRHNIDSQRELLSKLYIPDFHTSIMDLAIENIHKFTEKVENEWSKQIQDYLYDLGKRYKTFFSMFNRIPQVHVFILYSLCVINGETFPSFETKRIFERLISLLHRPIDIESFHNPDFDNYTYIGERRIDIIKYLEKHKSSTLTKLCDVNRPKVKERLQRMVLTGELKRDNDWYSLNPAYSVDSELSERYKELIKGDKNVEDNKEK